MLKVNIRQLARFSFFLLRRFEQNENRKNAAALTFVTLFAIVPIMTSAYAAFTLVPQFSASAEQFQIFIFQHFVPATGEAIQGYLTDFSEQARGLTWIGLVILFLSAMSLMLTIENAFNRVWRVNSARIGRRIILYWLIIVLGPLLFASIFILSSYLLGSDLWLKYVDGVFNVNHQIIQFLPFLLSSLTLAVMYFLLPSCRVRFSHALIGGVVAALIMEMSKAVFVYLVSLAPAYKIIYGTFALLPLFLLWLYVAWCVVLLGAELVRALPFVHKQLKGINASQMDWALLILQLLYQEKHQKEHDNGIARECLLGSLSLVDADEWESVLLILIKQGWIANRDDDFFLNVNLDQIEVAELSELLHGKRLEEIAVLQQSQTWFTILSPLLLDLRKQKKAVLGLPISHVIASLDNVTNA